jgi:hypothetical protein
MAYKRSCSHDGRFKLIEIPYKFPGMSMRAERGLNWIGGAPDARVELRVPGGGPVREIGISFSLLILLSVLVEGRAVAVGLYCLSAVWSNVWTRV